MSKHIFNFLLILVVISACSKSNSTGTTIDTPPGGDSSAVKLSYGDSVFYVKDGR